ncbi:DNA primase small subunit-like isoform X3 [Branchiostoma lanceolatum]|uniref:DNA primase small subunit-like isoform X3 n=1 Tax=Branchiostoma lanceolatum TaxID=7740 RepID=UPI003452AF29
MAEGEVKQSTAENTAYDRNDLPELLPIYYKRLFPYGPYYKWLSYGGVQKSYFHNREFSFTLKDDIYIRYQSFADQSEMEKEIQRVMPYKIDIGAVFSHKPKDHKTVKPGAFIAQEKELVFDIDMTDYDDVRNCCSGANICEKCWPLMVIAIKIVDRALRDDFGFEHRLWVYSGRRGVHCWVCDESTRQLSQTARTAIAEYLSVVKGGESQTKKVSLREPMHPSLKAAFEIMTKHLKHYLFEQQDILGTEDRLKKVLRLFPEAGLREILQEDAEKGGDSEDIWKRWLGTVRSEKERDNMKKSPFPLHEVVFQYCYPRLDVNVSKGVNHLLKSPFCIHPKTGRVCVPIDVEDVDNFDPFTVPTISTLCKEIDEYKEQPGKENEPQPGTKRKVQDYQKTSLKRSVDIFNKFVKGLSVMWRGKMIENSAMSRGVRPVFGVSAWMSAPASTRSLTTLNRPPSAARCRGVIQS